VPIDAGDPLAAAMALLGSGKGAFAPYPARPPPAGGKYLGRLSKLDVPGYTCFRLERPGPFLGNRVHGCGKLTPGSTGATKIENGVLCHKHSQGMH